MGQNLDTGIPIGHFPEATRTHAPILFMSNELCRVRPIRTAKLAAPKMVS